VRVRVGGGGGRQGSSESCIRSRTATKVKECMAEIVPNPSIKGKMQMSGDSFVDLTGTKAELSCATDSRARAHTRTPTERTRERERERERERRRRNNNLWV
jgi:hypothetical protein